MSSDELPIALPGAGVAPARPAPAKAAAAKPATTPARVATTPPGEAPPTSDPVWAKIRQCESGNRYALNTGNGYYGAYQFAAATWRRLGLAGLPHEAPPALQDEAARLLYLRSGWKAWGSCARRLGLT